MELSWNIPGNVEHKDWKQNNSTADPPHSWNCKSRFYLFMEELSWQPSCVTMQFFHLLAVTLAWYRTGDTCLDVLLDSNLDYTIRNVLKLYSVFRTNACPHVLIMFGNNIMYMLVYSLRTNREVKWCLCYRRWKCSIRGTGNENSYCWMPLWCDNSFHQVK